MRSSRQSSDRARRPGRLHRVESRGDGVGDAAGPARVTAIGTPEIRLASNGVGVEVQPGDHAGGESVGRLGQRGFALRGRQRPDLALSADGARNIQRRNDAQLDDRRRRRWS